MSSKHKTKLIFIDESFIILSNDYIINLTDDGWFLKNLIEDIPNQNTVEDIQLDESKENVVSIIETLKAGKLCIRDSVNLNYFRYLCDKWCLPFWITEQLDEKINSKNFKLTNDNLFKICTLQCQLCRKGFKLYNNDANSCRFHPGKLENDRYTCCGKRESQPCQTGYHVPYFSQYQVILEKFQN
jgi:hypothetical protein